MTQAQSIFAANVLRDFQNGAYSAWANEFNTQKEIVQLRMVMDLFENLDCITPENYPQFLNDIVIGVFVSRLKNEPVFVESAELRIRSCILNIIERIPRNEHLFHYVEILLDLLYDIILHDNEENAIISIRMVSDFFTYRNLDSRVGPFYKLFKSALAKFQSAFCNLFSTQNTSITQQNFTETTVKKPQETRIPASNSLKLLNEFPTIFVLVWRHYPKLLIPRQLADIIALLVDVIKLTPPHNSHENPVFQDLVNAQSLCLTCLVVLLKDSDPGNIRDIFKPISELPTHIIRLLKIHSLDSNTRKDIISAVRHLFLIASQYKKQKNLQIYQELKFEYIFPDLIAHIDDFCDVETLLGFNNSSYLQHYAVSLIADFIHIPVIFEQLTLNQLSHLANFYAYSLSDQSNHPMSFTVISRLLRIVDPLTARQDNFLIRREVVLKLVKACVNKLDALKQLVPEKVQIYSDECINKMELCKEKFKIFEKRKRGFKVENTAAEEDKTLEKIKEKSKPKLNSNDRENQESCSIELNEKSFIHYQDLRAMISTLIEKIFNCITLVNEKFDKLLPNRLVTMNEDIALFDQLLCTGIECMAIYYLPCLESIDLKNTGFLVHINESKKDFNSLCHSFQYLDSNIFAGLFESRMPFLLEQFVKNPILYDFFDTMTKLKNCSNGRIFIELSLNFLSNKISTAEHISEFPTIHKLLKILFLSINTSYKNELEAILRPHISYLVYICVEKAINTVDPINYLTVIKLLFRNFSSQKTPDFAVRTSLFSKELMGILPSVIKKLNKLYHGTMMSTLRDLIVELVLSIPVRESTLLPSFKFLVKFLISALESTDIEIYISQSPKWLAGLRFLENIIEKLNSEFLNSFLDEYKPRLMKSLWSQLRPVPTSFTSHIFRILGRMGGRNRHFMIPPRLSIFPVQYKKGLHIVIPLKPNQKLEIPLYNIIHAARRLLLSSVISTSFWTPLKKQQSFLLLKTIFSLFFQVPESFDPEKMKHIIKNLKFCNSNSSSEIYTPKFVDPESPIPILMHPDYSFRVFLNKNNDDSNGDNENATATNSKFERPRVKLTIDYEAEKATFKLLSNTIIIASVIDYAPKEESIAFLEKIVTYFAISYASNTIADFTFLLQLDPRIFIESVVDVFVCENREHAKAAYFVLDRLFFIWDLISATSENFKIENLSVLDLFFYYLCGVCYKKGWHFKAGGLMGLKYLVLKLSASWTQNRLKTLLRAIFYIFKDLKDIKAKTLRDDINDFITLVIKTTLSGNNNPAVFKNLLDILIANLMSTNSGLRKQIRNFLQLSAELSGIQVVELIKPYKTQIVNKIFEFPFSKLSKKQKVIYLDTLSYLLNLKLPLLNFTQNIVEFLSQIVALIESDEFINTNLQILIVNVLVSAIDSQETLIVPDQSPLRLQIISVFLKCLSRKPEKLEQSARNGLEILFHHNSSAITKRLQNILKSTLQNLNSGNLTEEMMESFHKYIMLSPKSFTSTLGDKLMEQIIRKVEAEADSTDGNKYRICGAIIDSMALLSLDMAILPQIVQIVLKLESSYNILKGNAYSNSQMQTITNILRNPLIRYLNKYPAEALTYFFSKFAEESDLFYLYLNILKNPEAKELRREFSKFTQALIDGGEFRSESMSDESYKRRASIVAIIHSLVSFDSDWLYQHRDVLDCLYDYLISPQLRERPFSDIPRSQLDERRNLLICFIEYLKLHHMDNFFLLFDMAFVFTCTKYEEYYFLDSFYKEYVLEYYNIEEKRIILTKFFGEYFYNTKPYATSNEQKYQVMKHLIVPMIVHSLANSDGVENSENSLLTPNIINNYFVPIYTISNERDASLNFSNLLSIELLQLAAFIIKKNHRILEDQKKEFIRFAWYFLKNEDLFTRQSAYLLVSRFICSYETPIRISLQIYKALVKAYHSESRHLVKEALDVLLSKETVNKLKSESINGISGWILLIKFTRKALIDESHNLPFLVHILKLLVRQDAIFYTHRSFFAPHILNSLSRVSVIPSLEAKKLAFNIVEMILNWERKRISHKNANRNNDLQSNSAQDHDKMDVEGNQEHDSDFKTDGNVGDANKKNVGQTAVNQEESGNEFKPNHFHMDLIVNLLVSWATATFLSFIHDPNQEIITLYSRSLGLLSDALSMWPVVNLKFSTLTRFWDDNRQDFLKGTVSSLCVLHTILKTHAKIYLTAYSSEFDRLTHLLFVWNSVDIFKAYNRCLRIMISSYPCFSDSPIQSLYSVLISQLQRNLETAPFDLLEQFLMSLKILTCQGETEVVLDDFCNPLRLTLPIVSKDVILAFLPTLVRVFKRLVEEYILHDNYSLQIQNSEQQKTKIDPNLILFILKLLVEELESLKDMTNEFLSIFQLLIEKSSDELFLLHLIPITYFFIRHPYLNLSCEEINVYIQKLRRCEKARTLPLSRIYYDIIYALYTNPNFGSDQISQLELAAMSALTQRDMKIREKFLALFKKHLKMGFLEHLKVIFNYQTWKLNPGSTSTSQAVELLFSQFELDAKLELSSTCALMCLPGQQRQLFQVDAEYEENQFEENADFNAATTTVYNDVKMVSESELETRNNLESILDGTSDFLMGLSSLTVRDLVDPLSQIIFFEFELGNSLWVTLFSCAWSQIFTSEEREELTQILEKFLSPDSLTHQMPAFQSDFVKAIIHGIVKCSNPKLVLSPPLLSLVGSKFCTWNACLFILEERLIESLLGNLESDPGVVIDFPNHPPIFYDSLCNLYSKLDEKDFLFGIWINRSVTDDTRAGLVLAQQGVWNRAQEVFYQALHDYNKKLFINVPQFELMIWESQWIECARRLNQWDVLASYGQKIGSFKLTAEALWKMDEWDTLRELIEKQNIRNDSYKTKIFQIYLSLNDYKIAQVDALAKVAMSLIVTKWNTYPHTPSCPAYTKLLQAMQSTLEFYESGKIVRELKSQDISTKIIDLKSNLLKMWRERLPHQCDDIILWHEILQWRQHVFSMVTQALNNIASSSSLQSSIQGLGHHETAWTINKFAQIARKQGLLDVAFNALPKIYQLINIEIQDAFTKVKEHIKCWFKLPMPMMLGGFDIIVTTNLEFFTPPQKAQFYQLKGDFYAKSGAYEEASRAYSLAIGTFSSLSQAWTAWGKFYDKKFEALFNHLPSGSKKLLDTEKFKPLGSLSKIEDLTLDGLVAAFYAIFCYLRGIQSNSSVSARKMLGRAIWLLNYDVEVVENSPNVAELEEIIEREVKRREGEFISEEYQNSKMKIDIKLENENDISASGTASLTRENGDQQTEERPNSTPATPPTYIVNSLTPVTPATPINTATNHQSSVLDHYEGTSTTKSADSLAQKVKEVKKLGLLKAIFSEISRHLPPWIWISWIPQLITGLLRSEAVLMSSLLKEVGNGYISAVFYPLRAFIQTLREKVRPNSTFSGQEANDHINFDSLVNEYSFDYSSSSNDWTNSFAFEVASSDLSKNEVALKLAEDCLACLYSNSPCHLNDLDRIASNITRVFRPSIIEETLEAFHAIQNTVTDSTISLNLKPEIVYKKLNIIKNTIFNEFSKAKKNSFYSRFEYLSFLEVQKQVDEEIKNHPIIITNFTKKISNWIEILSLRIQQRPRWADLNKSEWLVSFQNEQEIDVPGLLSDCETEPENRILIDKFEIPIRIIKSRGQAKRVLTIRGMDGKFYQWWVEIIKSLRISLEADKFESRSVLWAREHRHAQILNVIKRFVNKDLQIKKRGINFTVPNFVLLSSYSRMVSINKDAFSLDDLYLNYCQVNGLDIYRPMKMNESRYLKDTSLSDSQLLNIYVKSKEATFNNLINNFLLEHTNDSYDGLWHLRKISSGLYAIHTLTQYLFSTVLQATPKNIFFIPESGVFQISNNYPRLTPDGDLEKLQSVSIRLTQNMIRFIGPLLHGGFYDAIFTAATHCLSKPSTISHIYQQLLIYYRDDLYELELPIEENTLLSKVKDNAKAICERMKEISLPEFVTYRLETTTPINRKITLLLKSATDPNLLSKMPVNWVSWI